MVILVHVLAVDDGLAAIRAALGPTQQEERDRGEVLVDTGLVYVQGHPVRIRIRRRAHRYDLTDDGAAVADAGRPAGWLEEIDRLVAEEGFNINRRGVVFVPAVHGRDIATLALRLAETSRAVYLALLDLQDHTESGRRAITRGRRLR